MGEYAVAKTSVWWDIENCCVPRRCDPQLIVQNMSSALATAGYRGPISVSAYGDTHQIAHNVQHALSSTGVSLNHVPAGIKDASDKRILVDMLFWAIDNPPPANYLLISGDRDFSNAIHKLKMRRYNILLAQPPNVSQTLTAAAKSVWLWKSLVAGEPPLAQSPYISSTSSGNKVDLDKSKNIVSSSSDVTQDTNPEVQNILCDPQSDANGKADEKYEVNKPRELQTDNMSKQARRKQKQRSNPGGSGFTKQIVFKKSKGGSRKRLICFRCGDGHCAAECTFSGDCHCCGKPGHKDLLCRANPDRIFRRIPAQAHDLATSLPGPVDATSSSQLQPTCSSPLGCSQLVTPDVLSPSPAPPVAPAPPQTCDRPSSGPAHSGVYAMPTAVEVCRDDVAQSTTSAPRPPMAVPAYRPGQGQGMICFKCGVVGHCAAECSYIGSCHHCGQLGHMESVCKDNPDSIIKWEQVHAYASATSLQGSVHMNVPASQLHQTWTPSSGCFLQATPTVPTPSPTPAAPALPHTGVAASSTPAQSGDCAMPTAVSLVKQDVVPQPTSSALCPPTSVLAYRPVLGQYHQVSTSQLPPAWTQPPHTGVAASSTPARSGVCAMPTDVQLGKPDVVPQLTSSAFHPPTAVLAYRPVLGQYHQVGTSQLLPALTQPPGYFWQAAPVVPAPHVTPVPPQPGVAASLRPAHYGVYPPPPPPPPHAIPLRQAMVTVYSQLILCMPFASAGQKEGYEEEEVEEVFTSCPISICFPNSKLQFQNGGFRRGREVVLIYEKKT